MYGLFKIPAHEPLSLPPAPNIEVAIPLECKQEILQLYVEDICADVECAIPQRVAE